MSFLLKRLSQKNSWNKVFMQRLTEPFHLNLIALFVFVFGSFRKKVAYDLVIRPQHAFGLLNAADQAKLRGFSEVTVVEFGVSFVVFLFIFIVFQKKIKNTTGVTIHIYGFDTGEGMPEPIDYRDHPEYYNTGDFPMNKALLEEKIKGKATIIYGPIKEKIAEFISTISEKAPIGFIAIDVDYYSSTKDVLELFKAKARSFLPLTYVYMDDIFMPHHNEKCGELLAVSEFNADQSLRQLSYHRFFENQRIFKNANWVKQLYYFHVLDHPYRSELKRDRNAYVLDNPYLTFEGNKKQFD
jgi:hypothetical protein